MKKSTFKMKDDPSQSVRFSLDEVEEIIPDADMRNTLVILKNGDKHFVQGTEDEIRGQLKSKSE
ncbi:MAG: hypothetical protein ABIN80_04685 [Dyadobacter sp.]|uniref:hypothetical protein n=1 Tax=Dyadobacter sp. TaxID=1914288 RepID=UPI003264ADA9